MALPPAEFGVAEVGTGGESNLPELRMDSIPGWESWDIQ